MKQNPKVYDWDWAGACSPGFGADAHAAYETFSVGIFQWLPKAGGKGLKRSKVVRRIKGRCDKPEGVYKEADIVVAHLDNVAHGPQGAPDA